MTGEMIKPVIQKIKKAELKKLLEEKNLLEFNRDIQPRHVEKMRNSVMDCGILRLPVIGDVSAFDSRGKVIVDGQHLCKALVTGPKGVNSVVDVIVKTYESKKQLIDDISKLNNTQKSWNDENYLEAWFKYGKTNYSHFTQYYKLYDLYNNKYDGLPCGLLIDLYARSKSGFREGTLEFRDEQFSDKLTDLCFELQNNHNKASFALHGLRVWAFDRLNSKKTIDWTKLKSRLTKALRNGEDKNIQGREDFRDFVAEIYNLI
mgnify:FL=1|tara:strand:- start:17 stop:799 length:783 start_codon:yes stop_codon:yes gene_type:complete